jgi:hypothetical protein
MAAPADGFRAHGFARARALECALKMSSSGVIGGLSIAPKVAEGLPLRWPRPVILW